MTVSDEFGCERTFNPILLESPDPLIINNNEELQTQYNGFSVSCNEDNNGIIDITVTGGTGLYIFEWTDEFGEIISNNEDLIGINAGIYNVLVTDENGNFQNLTIEITEPELLTISNSNNSLQEQYVGPNGIGVGVSCFGASDGQIEILVDGGTGINNLTWTFTNTNGDITENFSPQFISETALENSTLYFIDNLSAGEYKIKVEDNNLCVDEITVILNENNELLMSYENSSFYSSGYGVSCQNASDGFINIFVEGGSENYQFLWTNENNDVLESDENGNISNLSPGFYSVVVTDENYSDNDNCFAEILDIEIEDYEPAIVTWSVSQDDLSPEYNISCNGGNDGEININISGGTENYSFSWVGLNSDNEIIFESESENISDLFAGTYILTTNSYDDQGNLCLEQENIIELIQPDEVILTYETIDVIPEIGCTGECAGSILVDVQGGIAPYSLTLTQYTESGSTIIQNIESINSSEMPYAFESLCAGNYSISTFDSNASLDYNGCNSFVADIIIEQPLPVEVSIESVSSFYECDFNVSCNNGTDGFININTVGGSGLYNYSWTGVDDENNIIFSSSSEDISNLSAGTYTLIVTDVENPDCFDTIETILIEPTDEVTINQFSIDNIATYCLDNGSISFEIDGGCGIPYTVSLFNSDDNGNILNDIDGSLSIYNGIQYVETQNQSNIQSLGEGWYSLIVSDGNEIFDLNSCDSAFDSITFFIEETDAPEYDLYAEPDLSGIINYQWLGEIVNPAPETNVGISSCESNISILNPEGILGNFGGTDGGIGVGYELFWFIDNNSNEQLDIDDTPLDEFNNEFNAIVDVQTMGQNYLLQYVDLCENGPIDFITPIEVPLMELEIVAQSSVSLIEQGGFSTEDNISAISCFGENDAFASLAITGGSEDDFNNSSCLDNQTFFEVTWYLDNGDTEFNDFDTQIIEGSFNDSDTNNDDIFDNFRLEDLSPGYYFALIQDCLSPGCALVVDFDLRPEPEPIDYDIEVIQTNCESNEEPSVCVEINGGVPFDTPQFPYNLFLSMLDPNNPGDLIIPTLNFDSDGCVTSPELQPGSYEIYVEDSNSCSTETVYFDINLVNLIDPALIEINLLTYQGGYNVSCFGESDGLVESITIYSLEDLDGDGFVNTALNADVDGDGIINTLDYEDFVNGVPPAGIDTDDVIGVWTPSGNTGSFLIDWGQTNPTSLSAGNYSFTISSTANNSLETCETELEFEIGSPEPLYVYVPDYETCPNCPVNVNPIISSSNQSGQGPFIDIWTNLETGEVIQSSLNNNIGPNDVVEIGIDYDVSTLNGYPNNIKLLPGSYSLTIIDGGGNNCGSTTTEFEIYAPQDDVEWAEIQISGCNSLTSNCGGIAAIDIDYSLFDSQLIQIAWYDCDGNLLSGSQSTENIITDLCIGQYYAEILYPSSFDDSTFDPEDIDNDGIPNSVDPFPNGEYNTAKLCFEYNYEIFEVVTNDIQHDLCFDENNEGSYIDISIQNGIGEFSYNWVNESGETVSTNQDIYDIESGVYTLYVTDESGTEGCELIEQYEIFSAEPIIISSLGTNIDENNGYDVPCPQNSESNECGGIIYIEIEGGIPFNSDIESNDFSSPTFDGDEYYLFTINNLDNDVSTSPSQLNVIEIVDNTIIAEIANVCGGENIVDIIANFDCNETFSVQMSQPDLFDIDVDFSDVSCPNSQDGAIEISFSGGTGNYNYDWFLNGELFSNQSDLYEINGGEYQLIISDDNDCEFETFVDIYEPQQFDVSWEIIQPGCSRDDGFINFIISGGNDNNYQVLYEDQTYSLGIDESIQVPSGQHEFVITDSQGCESEILIIDITPISEDCLTIPSLFTPNGDGLNDIWEIGGIEDFPDAEINIYNRWGQLIFKSSGNYFGNEWDGTFNNKLLPFAVYYYTIDPVNENGKTYNGGVTIKY